MSFLDRVLSFKSKVPIKDVCTIILRERKKTFVCEPKVDMSVINLVPEIKGRLAMVKNKAGQYYYVIKNDEQIKANELSFVANLLQCYFDLPNIPMALMEFPYSIMGSGKINNTKTSYMQLMPYLSGFHEFSIERAKTVTQWPSKLAKCVAFFFYLYDFDNFLFLGRFADNIIFADDPEYSVMNLTDDPIINPGNLLIYNDDFLMIDIRPQNSMNQILEAHLIALNFDYKITGIVANIFQMNNDEKKLFLDSFTQSFVKYLKDIDKFQDLHAWAIEKK